MDVQRQRVTEAKRRRAQWTAGAAHAQEIGKSPGGIQVCQRSQAQQVALGAHRPAAARSQVTTKGGDAEQ